MDSLLEFLSFSDPNLRLVTLGTMFLGLSAAMVGSFAFLRKRSLIGDAIAHAILPGIALSFLLFQSKNPLLLMGGALISGWLAMLSIDYISAKSKIKADTAIGLVLSVFFGIGILLLTHIQHSGAGNQAGLDQFLFGKAAAMSMADLKLYALVAVLLLTIIFFLFKEFKLLSFNPDFAIASGLPVKRLRFILSTITVLAIALGIQSVGVVLMAALIITPSAAARAWTDKLSIMMLLAGLIGASSGLVGSYISFTAPSMPTGPWIVMCLSFAALTSLFLSPRRGVLARVLQQRRNRVKIVSENLLKSLYHLHERSGFSTRHFSESDINEQRSFSKSDLRTALKKLKREYWLLNTPQEQRYQLSAKGMEEARRVVRLHRLWEMYLTERMRLKSDHIHPNAESIEHIITPEIEALLLKELNYPEKDPHESIIPYNS
jgi:manganese/zinc/iron transport system permease protein